MKFSNITLYGILTKALRCWRTYELRRVFRKLCNGRRILVLSGPFQGMIFTQHIDIGTNLSKIVGSYESELHPVINELVLRNCRTIVNIGAAEGYYSVGMAMLLQHCKVYAFELNESQRQKCAETACLNNVMDRVVVLGKCDIQVLSKLELQDATLIVDCEGAEIDILNPDLVPALTYAFLLVELHDAIRPGCSRVLWQRFNQTHDMKFISAVVHDPTQYTCLDKLHPIEKILALEENRLGVQEWVFMTPKGANAAI